MQKGKWAEILRYRKKKEIVWARIWLNYAKGGIKYLSVCGPLIIGY